MKMDDDYFTTYPAVGKRNAEETSLCSFSHRGDKRRRLNGMSSWPLFESITVPIATAAKVVPDNTSQFTSTDAESSKQDLAGAGHPSRPGKELRDVTLKTSTAKLEGQSSKCFGRYLHA